MELEQARGILGDELTDYHREVAQKVHAILVDAGSRSVRHGAVAAPAIASVAASGAALTTVINSPPNYNAADLQPSIETMIREFRGIVMDELVATLKRVGRTP